MAFPSRMSRYVFAELVPPTLLGVFLYTFVLMMNHFFLVAEKALSKNLSWELTSRLFLLGIPEILLLSIPMSVLLGVMIAVGRLSADQEWTALQSAGQGPMVLLKPIITFGAVWALLAMALYGFVVPRTSFSMRNLRGEMLFASNLAADLKPRVFYTDLPDVILFIDDIQPGTDQRLRDVLLIRMPAGERRTTELLLARRGDLYPAPDRNGTLILDLYDGITHLYRSDAPDETYRVVSFTFRRTPLEMAGHLQAFLQPPRKIVRDLSPAELLAEYREARAARAQVAAESVVEGPGSINRLIVVDNRLRTAAIELHQRLAIPLACLFFSMLALPLGITRVRSGKGAGFALSLAVIMIYWAAFTLGRNQASAGNIPVWLGTWSGNLIILPWALYALWKMKRGLQRSPDIVGALFSYPARLWRATTSRSKKPRAAPRAIAGLEALAEGDIAVPAALSDLSGTSGRFIGRLDQYVTVAFLRVLGFAVLSAYTVYALVDLKALMDDALRNDKPLSLIPQYLQYFAPGVLHIVLPIACLVGGVVTFSLLTRSGELVAIKSSGVSMRRITLPVIVVTLLLCGLLFIVDDRIAPASNRKAQSIKDQISNRSPRTYGAAGSAGRWSFGPDGKTLYHYRLWNPADETFQQLSVLTLDRSVPQVLDHLYARDAVYTDGAWELSDSWYRSFSNGTQPGEFRHDAGTAEGDLPPPEDFTYREMRLSRLGDLAEQMSVGELRREIQQLEASGYEITRLRVEFHSKWAHPLAPLVMVLLGLPFAFKVGRRGSLYGVGVALILVLVYWATLATFNALGLERILDPVIAAWTPNILFGLIGTYLMLYIET